MAHKNSSYRAWVAVTVYDLAQLREYAWQRAKAIGMSEDEFDQGSHDDPESNATYWLGWAFDAGTPEHCGFQIEGSGCDFEGVDLV